MSTTDESKWPRLEQPDTSNATFIAWHKKDDKNNYDPDTKWQDDRYPRCYGDYYQNLDEYNNGYKNGKYRNKAYYNWLENDRLISSVSQQMELSSRERSRAKGLFHQLPLGKFWGFKEDIAVIACLYVIEHDKKDQRRGDPNTLKKCQYLLIEQKFRVSRRKIVKNYGKIENRVRTGRLNEAPQEDKYRGTFSVLHKAA